MIVRMHVRMDISEHAHIRANVCEHAHGRVYLLLCGCEGESVCLSVRMLVHCIFVYIGEYVSVCAHGHSYAFSCAYTCERG
jgi:hypothetical protein